MGKGSKPRPLSISKTEFDDRWSSINWKKQLSSIERMKEKYICTCEICLKNFSKNYIDEHRGIHNNE